MKQGWEVKRLGDVLQIERGGSPRPIKKYLTDNSDGLNWIKISDATASNKYIYHTKQKITKDGLHKTRLVEEGDFILSNSMSFGKPYIMKIRGCIHDGWLVLKEKNGFQIDKDFLYHLLCSPNLFKQFDGLAAGSTVRNLNILLVSSVSAAIPPLVEQKQIVAQLDQCFEAINKAKANTLKNLENAKELFESYLQAAFDNKGDEWEVKRLGDVCDFTRGPFGGSLKKSIFVDKGIAIYEQQHAINNQFDQIRYFITDKKFKEMQRFELLPNDLIMSCSGTMGKMAIVPSNVKKGIINQALLKLTTSKKIEVNYLKLWMESEKFQNEIAKYSQGAAIKNVASVKILKQIQIPTPPLFEQKQIVKKLDALQSQTKKLEAIYQQKIYNLEELKKSILQKAFNGEL